MQKILLIEDDRDINESNQTALELEGYEVRTALSMHAGVNLCETFHTDLVLLDIILPDANALDWGRRLKEDYGVNILRRNAKYHDTVDSYVELGKAMRLYGWILEARNGDGDIEKAHALYLKVKEIHTMLKERGAKGDASELSMIDIFIKRTEKH